MQCNQPIVIAITQSLWQSCSSATFVKVGVLQPKQYYFNVIIYLSIYELGARHSPLRLRAEGGMKPTRDA
eukprot:1857938-Prymnesium_polylepis.1